MGPSQDLAWGWAGLALIMPCKFTDMSLGTALSVSVKKNVEKQLCAFAHVFTRQAQDRCVVAKVLGLLMRDRGRKLGSSYQARLNLFLSFKKIYFETIIDPQGKSY